MSNNPGLALPILDLSQLSGSETDRSAFLSQLRYAAREIGFFYLINHGISPELQQAVQDEARSFFALPDEDKQQVAMIHSPHFRGYNRAASRTGVSSSTLALNARLSRLMNTLRHGDAYRGQTFGQRHNLS